MTRIAIIVGKMNSGGKKTLIMQYYHHIDRTQFQFDFIVDKDSNSVPQKEIEEMGGKVFWVTPYQHIFKYMKEVYQICKDNKYLIVHSYLSTMSLFALKSAKKAGVPIRINESLSMANPHELKSVLKMMLKPMAKWYSTNLAACGYDCAQWQFGKKAIQAGKVAIFNTVIDGDKYRYDESLREKVRSELGLEKNTVVGFIGRFEKQKNPLFLIDYVAAMVKLDPSVVLILVGIGPMQEKILNRIKQNKIENNVKFLGRTEDILGLYMAMDCFLLPSLYEGLPVVGLEAQAVGLPTIFSTEVTSQVSISDSLALFISLKESANQWAIRSLEFIKKPRVRRSYDKELNAGHFNSIFETAILEKYYISLIKAIQ
jgi:glycosyltransferase involved in cell wall biosynthesis